MNDEVISVFIATSQIPLLLCACAPKRGLLAIPHTIEKSLHKYIIAITGKYDV